jgi:hypothetical protein
MRETSESLIIRQMERIGELQDALVACQNDRDGFVKVSRDLREIADEATELLRTTAVSNHRDAQRIKAFLSKAGA